MNQPPLTSIAERRSQSGDDDSEDEEDDVHGGWRTPEVRGGRNSLDEGVIKAGYLWKKGERRKVRFLLYSDVVLPMSNANCTSLDVEETLVCAATRAFGLLQKLERVSASQTVGTVRCTFVHASQPETT